MKTIHLILLALLCLLTPAVAFAERSPLELAQEAEQAYRNNQYERAVHLYEKLAQRYPYDPAVLYNLGTAYARQGEGGRATWRYLQALELAPRDQVLRSNLNQVTPNWREDLAATPIPPLNAILMRLTADEWSAIALSTTIATLLLGAILLRYAPTAFWGGLLRRAIIILVVLAALSWPPALIRYHWQHNMWRGVIVSDAAPIRTGPSESQIVTLELPGGKVVQVLERTEDDWLRIQFAGNKRGFVAADDVEFL